MSFREELPGGELAGCKTQHDRKVRKIAAAYWERGFDVRADLPEYQSPKPIRGKIADVVAKKGKKTIIVEVETPESFGRDRNQRGILSDYAKSKPRTTFRWTRTR